MNMSRFRSLVLGLVLVGLVSTRGAQAQRPTGPTSPAPLRGALVLKPGDALRISVWRDSELSGEFQIAPDGTVIHPMWRAIRVAGIPLPEVETRLRTFLEGLQSQPQFVVEPLLRVTVGGEVTTPNLYFVRTDITASQVVSLAGGATERGRRDRVRLVADGRVRYIKLDGYDSSADLPVRSGDQYIVESRSSVFRDVIVPLIGVAGAAAAIINVSRSRN